MAGGSLQARHRNPANGRIAASSRRTSSARHPSGRQSTTLALPRPQVLDAADLTENRVLAFDCGAMLRPQSRVERGGTIGSG